VESAVYRSITAVVQKDEALANDVLKNEGRINQIEIVARTISGKPWICFQ
jgi:hypothetical protein